MIPLRFDVPENVVQPCKAKFLFSAVKEGNSISGTCCRNISRKHLDDTVELRQFDFTKKIWRSSSSAVMKEKRQLR